MANHGVAAAAALLLTVSLLVVVALSGADARTAVLPDKVSSVFLGGGNHDAYSRGMADPAMSAVVDPECDGEEDNHSSHKHHHKQHQHHKKHHGDDNKDEYPDHKYHTDDDDDDEYLDYPEQPCDWPYPEANSVEQELCSECEEPKMLPPPPPPCNTCEEPMEPELKCNKVHAVRDGETCYSVGQCAGLGQDDFLRFNPNICCDKLFVGQWVCLDATCDA